MKHSFENDIICPYCDKEQEKDRSTHRKEYLYDLICQYCEKKFDVELYEKLEYSTEGNCRTNNELPHILIQINEWLGLPENKKEYECSKCFSGYYEWQLSNGKYPKLKENEYVIITNE